MRWPVKQGQPVKFDNIHMTLAFIGDADVAYRECLQQAAESVSSNAFKFYLDRQGYFVKPRILWLGSNTLACPHLMALHESLIHILRACAYVPETRPYKPHVTLYRKAMPVEKPLLYKPIEWYVDSFYLVESQSRPEGVHYEKLKRYALKKE